MLEDDKNPNTLRNSISYKKGFKKVPQRVPKTQGGGGMGVKAIWKKSKQKQIIFIDGFPKP
jgi:hypothetical protein